MIISPFSPSPAGGPAAASSASGSAAANTTKMLSNLREKRDVGQKIVLLENRLDGVMTNFNATLSQNALIRKDIDHLVRFFSEYRIRSICWAEFWPIGGAKVEKHNVSFFIFDRIKLLIGKNRKGNRKVDCWPMSNGQCLKSFVLFRGRDNRFFSTPLIFWGTILV